MSTELRLRSDIWKGGHELVNSEQLEAWSQEQHRRYLELFGTAPVDGGGFRDLGHLAERVGKDLQDTRAETIELQFSTAVTAAYTGATMSDHLPLVGASAALGVWGSVTDESRQININGAEAIAANARREAAAVGAVPDPDSPAGKIQVLGLVNEHQARAAAIVEQAAAAARAAGARAAAAGGDDHGSAAPRVQAVDHRTFKEEPPPPPPNPPPEGIHPEGVRPPVEGPLTEGPASRPSRRDAGGRSLYDQDGGEWRYYPGDQWRHAPHWDYKPQPGPGSPWQNIPIDGQPPVNNPPPIVTSLPPWLLAPDNVSPTPALVPGHNPLLAPFPGASMPAPPEVSMPTTLRPDPIPHINAPHFDPPPPEATAGATAVAGGALLLYLLMEALSPG